MIKFGACLVLDGVYGLLMTKSGHAKTIMVFEKHGNQLIATRSQYTSNTRMESFKLLSEPSDRHLWCDSALIAGKLETIEWCDPAQIIDVVFPVGEDIKPEELPDSVSPVKVPRTPRSCRVSNSDTPSKGRKFDLTPKKLFGHELLSDFDSDDLASDTFSDEDVVIKIPRKAPSTPRKRSSRTATPTPKKQRVTVKSEDDQTVYVPDLNPQTPRKRKYRAAQVNDGTLKPKLLPESPHKGEPQTPKNKARNQLHAADVPETLPCRTQQFSRLFSRLQEAIKNCTGTCIYLSGTPGTGKSSTVREAIEQLMIRKEDGELADFDVLDINGMRLGHATLAYDALHEHLHPEARVATRNSMAALERQFNDKKNDMKPLIVIMEELDQLITKDQSVIYNFFNWPSLPNSRLIVVAVSNTLDMPERFLQNKIKSRIGLENIKFPGYSQAELREILNARLEDSDLVMDDAIEYVARKVGNVSGDARRALDICRRAVEITPDGEPVTLAQVLEVIKESQKMVAIPILSSLSTCSKLLLLGFFQYSKRSPELYSYSTVSVLEHCSEFIRSNKQISKIASIVLREGQVRMGGYQHALAELVEGGLVSEDNARGDATSRVRLNIDFDSAREALCEPELDFVV